MTHHERIVALFDLRDQWEALHLQDLSAMTNLSEPTLRKYLKAGGVDKPASKTRINYETFKQQIMSSITNEFTTTEMAAKLGVQPKSMHRALTILTNEGRLTRRLRGRTYFYAPA